MADLETQVPPWLQRNWSPVQSFDPTPWLQERYNRQIQQQTLPLQLQGMALKNQAEQLAIEHQGVVNDEFNDELKKEAADLPLYKQHSIEASNLPGGATAMGAPTFQSKKYNDLWKQRQMMDANTTYAEAMHQAMVTQTKQAADVMNELGIVVDRNPDGSFDEQKLATLSAKANLQRAAREQSGKIALAEARQEHYYDENGNLVVRGGTAGGYAPDVTEKQALALQRARTAIEQATTPEAKASATEFYRNLVHAQETQHPDKLALTEVQLLHTELTEAIRAYYQSGASDAKLLENVNRLKAEIKAAGSNRIPGETGITPPPGTLHWNPATEQLE